MDSAPHKNAIESINRVFKRRTDAMDTIGEDTFRSLVVFTALKDEIGWQKCRIDSKVFNQKRKEDPNKIEAAIDELIVLN